MELTLGPVLFEWKREELVKFYEEVAGMDIDRVYLGEVVCTRKLALNFDDIERIAGSLIDSGKKVVLSSLAVISNEEELEFTRRLAGFPYAIEANDMSVLNIADPSKREVLAGPHITAYNAPSIEFLKETGVRHVTFPVELPRGSVLYNIRETGIEAEVFVHGKVPLAFSWRCYTSRAFGLGKTECRHHCAKYPDGMEIKTMDGEPVFTVNGTTLLSASTYTLIESVEDLRDIGVKALRISPQYRETGKIVELFRRRMRGETTAEAGLEELKGSTGGSFCNGWYMGGAGKDYIAKARSSSGAQEKGGIYG
ncbi:MAG: U32 family peptidase [Deltaproteobacteria bacterium]|nr:U32 family peptidase [Deltaproteobacteria bacterium]